MDYQNSVVLITSADDNNRPFGTGFTIDQNGGYSYILTCAHVVRDASGEIGEVKVNGVVAKVEAISPPNSTDDFAVLRVNELFGFPLPRRYNAEEGENFTSLGYQKDPARTTQTFIAVSLQGTLGKSIFRQRQNQNYRTQLWALNFVGDNSAEGGNSGAPIVQDGHVVGVLKEELDGKFFAISIEALDRVWSEPTYVPFTNRVDERELILSSSAPAYYLLDGPAGYGKSTLLGELRKQFCERKWRCAYLALDKDTPLELDKLAEAIAEKLSVSGLPPITERDQKAGYRLGVALQTYWNNSQKYSDNSLEGIVLLFDFDRGFSNAELLERLLKQFIPQIQESLRNIAPFAHNDNRFRVVIAGRYLHSLYSQLSIQPSLIKLCFRYLTPFEFDVIQESTRLYLKKREEKVAKEIAEHILYLTGGHPGCMAGALQEYEKSGMGPESFVKNHSEKIWNEIVKPVFNYIATEFPTTDGADQLMKNNVLRYMDRKVLRKLADNIEISKEWGTNGFDEYNLSLTLTKAALLNKNKDNHLLHDDITRRVVCLGLRNGSKDEFVRLCQAAQTICEERLHDISNSTPDKWAIEYLFQFLQQHALLIHDAEQRRALRKNLIAKELPKVWQLLKSGREAKEQQSNLQDSIDNDWEFMFTVNYYLREAKYNDEPIRELKSAVERLK